MLSVFKNRTPWLTVLFSYVLAGVFLAGNFNPVDLISVTILSLGMFYVAYGYDYVGDRKEDLLA